MGCHPTRVAACTPMAGGSGSPRSPLLATVVYISRRTPGSLDDAIRVHQLIRRAAAANRRLGITGYLAMAGDHILQRLEGPEGALASLLDRLQGDPRHTNFCLVEQRPIFARSYPTWAMRGVELSASPRDPAADATSLVLQTLAAGVALGARCIPAPALRVLRRLQTPRHPFPVCSVHAIVVTVSLVGGTALLLETEDRRVAAAPSAIGAILRHLRDHIVSLQLPDGHGAAVLCTGMAFQVVLPAPPEASGLHQQVMQACRDLILGPGPDGADDLRIAVTCGRVRDVHFAGSGGRHCGRLLDGPAIRRGLATAHAMHAADYSLAAEPSLALAALGGFPQKPVWLAGEPLRALLIATTAAAATVGDSVQLRDVTIGEDAVALSCDDAVAALIDTESAGSDGLGDEAPGAEVALEWMYQLDSLSREFEREQQRKRKSGSPVMRLPSGTLVPSHSAGSGATAIGYVTPRIVSGGPGSPATPSGCQLLSVVYLSTLSEEAEDLAAEELGDGCAARNAQRQVTGFLLLARPYILQFLEGPPEAVKALFQRIQRDPRHTGVMILTSRLLPARQYGGWAMKVVDIQTDGEPDRRASLRDALGLLARQFMSVSPWLPRLDHDLLLAAVRPSPGAAVQCSLAAFALAPPLDDWGDRLPSLLDSLGSFLSRGGSLVGVLGPCLVGYVFFSHIPLLVEVVAQACASFVGLNAGLKTGNMLLLNVGSATDPPDLLLLGPLFEGATHLAAQAAASQVAIVADVQCRVPHPLVAWEQQEGAWLGSVVTTLSPLAATGA